MSLHQSVVFPWLGLCAAVAAITPNALVLTALNTNAPTLSPISDQVMDEDTSIVLSLVVGDAEDRPGQPQDGSDDIERGRRANDPRQEHCVRWGRRESYGYADTPAQSIRHGLYQYLRQRRRTQHGSLVHGRRQ